MTNLKLSVVIPAYNEAKNIQAGVLDEVADYLSKQYYTYEVLIVDDGSLDDTALLVEKSIRGKKGFRLLKNSHGGKALTVISGMLAAKGEIVLFTDMDQATPLNQIEKFFPLFEKKFDVVIGSRGGRKGAPLIRKLTALGFAVLRRVLIGLPLTDTQCGFKAFTLSAIKQVFPKMAELRKNSVSSGAAVNAGFDVETLYLAKKMKLKISEVKVDWHHVGTTRFNLTKDAIDALKDMIRIRINDLEGRYSLNLHEVC